jgi:hypothetical protein
MTNSEAKSAARTRVRAFLDARASYGESLPPGVVAQSMTDVIASQARESGISRVEFSGSTVKDVETLAPGTYDDTLERLLASDLALLVADEAAPQFEETPGDPDCAHERLGVYADSGASRCLDCAATFAPPPSDEYGRVITLPNEDFDTIAAALDEPATPVPELVDLIRRNRVTPTDGEG